MDPITLLSPVGVDDAVPPNDHRQDAVSTQAVVVVHVLVAQCDTHDAPRDHLPVTEFYSFGIPMVGEALRRSPCDFGRTVNLTKMEAPAARNLPSSGERGG